MMNGTKPVASAPDNPMRRPRRDRQPENAAREHDREAADHRGDRADVAAIEAALREPAGGERGEGIGHQVAAGWTEKPRRALGQHGDAAKTGSPAKPSAR